MKKMINSQEKNMCNLDVDQTSQMSNIMSKIGDNFDVELNSLFVEHSQNAILRQIWEYDKSESTKRFSQDKKKNETGKSGNRFSVITLRIALAIFSRSKVAYEALKPFEILSLPSVSTLKQYMHANVEDEEPMYERMEEEKTNFVELCQLKRLLKLLPH